MTFDEAKTKAANLSVDEDAKQPNSIWEWDMQDSLRPVVVDIFERGTKWAERYMLTEDERVRALREALLQIRTKGELFIHGATMDWDGVQDIAYVALAQFDEAVKAVEGK